MELAWEWTGIGDLAVRQGINADVNAISIYISVALYNPMAGSNIHKEREAVLSSSTSQKIWDSGTQRSLNRKIILLKSLI